MFRLNNNINTWIGNLSLLIYLQPDQSQQSYSFLYGRMDGHKYIDMMTTIDAITEGEM